jgi:hypothetical protein
MMKIKIRRVILMEELLEELNLNSQEELLEYIKQNPDDEIVQQIMEQYQIYLDRDSNNNLMQEGEE